MPNTSRTPWATKASMTAAPPVTWSSHHRGSGRGAIALISSYAACEAAMPVISAWS